MVPTVVAALFGSSLHTVAGPTNPLSLMVLATLSPLATPGTPHYAEIALTLALMSGVIMVAMGVLGLGALVNFMSSTVVVGFTAAVGVLIFASQLPNFLGIAGTPAAHFTDLVAGTFSRLGDAHPWVVLVAAATLAVGIGSRRLLPKIPPLLVAMLLGSVFAFVLNQMLGAERTGLRTLGPLRGVLPPLSLPDLSPGTLQSLLDAYVNYSYTAATFQGSFSLATPRLTPDCTAPPCTEFVRKGNDFPLIPRHRVNAGIDYHTTHWLTLSLGATFVSQQFLRGDEENVETPLDSYVVLRGGLSAQWRKFRAVIWVNNLLNAKYETFGTFAPNAKRAGNPIEPFLTPAPPINVMAGLTYRF